MSKKLSVTVATVAGLVASRAYAEAAAVAVAYVTTQGVIDHAEARRASSILGTLDEVVDAVRGELDKDPAPEPALTVTADPQLPGIVWPGI